MLKDDDGFVLKSRPSQKLIPRWNGAVVTDTDCESLWEWEREFVATQGCGDPLTRSLDEVRFSSTSNGYVGARLLVPQRLAASAPPWLSGPVVGRAVLTKQFECLPDRSWIADDGSVLAAVSSRSEGQVVAVNRYLSYLVEDGHIAGWALREPAKLLARDMGAVSPLVQVGILGKLLSQFAFLAWDADRLDALAASPGEQRNLQKLRSDVASVASTSTQAAVLLEMLDDLASEFA